MSRFVHYQNVLDHKQLEELHVSGAYLKRFAYSLSRYQNNFHLSSRARDEAAMRELLESLSESAYDLGMKDRTLDEFDILFPHRDLSRMFYATRRTCEIKEHWRYGAHIVLHTEPSKWLRLSYHLGCTPSPTEISPTLSHYYSSAVLDTPFNSFEEGIPIKRIIQDAFTYSDLSEVAGDLNWDTGLRMLSDSRRSKYESDQEAAYIDRQAVFEQNFLDRIW